MSRIERQYPRYAIEAHVVVRSPGAAPSEGRTANLSRGGLCAALAAPIAIGTSVDVALALVFGEDQYSEPLVLPARVAWCTSLGGRWQVGLAFRSLGERAPYLDLFLRYLADDQRSHAAEDEPGERDPFAD